MTGRLGVAAIFGVLDRGSLTLGFALELLGFRACQRALRSIPSFGRLDFLLALFQPGGLLLAEFAALETLPNLLLLLVLNATEAGSASLSLGEYRARRSQYEHECCRR